MIKGKLNYNDESDKWLLEVDGKEVNVSDLIYGFSDLSGLFPNIDEADGRGEVVEISFNVVR